MGPDGQLEIRIAALLKELEDVKINEVQMVVPASVSWVDNPVEAVAQAGFVDKMVVRKQKEQIEVAKTEKVQMAGLVFVLPDRC